MVCFTLRPLNSRGNRSRYPLDRKLGGPQSRSGHRRKEKLEPQPCSLQPVAISIELSTLDCGCNVGNEIPASHFGCLTDGDRTSVLDGLEAG
jgi:hypothetical protein